MGLVEAGIAGRWDRPPFPHMQLAVVLLGFALGMAFNARIGAAGPLC